MSMAAMVSSLAICHTPHSPSFALPTPSPLLFLLPPNSLWKISSNSTPPRPIRFTCKASRKPTNDGRIPSNSKRRRRSTLEEENAQEKGRRANLGDKSGEEVYYYDDFGEDEEEEEDDENNSLDLLARFTYNIYKMVSKKARKATRTILPLAISPQLVAFSVNGVIILTSLSILKAFLEVVCKFGSAVFVTILVLRLIWSAVAYIQTNGKNINFDEIKGYTSYSTS